MARNKDKFRFYRSNLESVIWDPETDSPLAKFIRGEFITNNPRIADKLEKLGYPRVDLDAINPPDIFFEKGESLETDIRILPNAVGETAALNREKSQAAIEKEKAEIKSPADYQKKRIKRRKIEDNIPESEKKFSKIKKRVVKKSATK